MVVRVRILGGVPMKWKETGDIVNECPVCGEATIHARAIDFPLLDPDNDFGYSLKVECPTHEWQDKGSGWTSTELRAAGLT